VHPKLNFICCISLLFIVACGDQEKSENLETQIEVDTFNSEIKIAKLGSTGDLERGRKLFIQCRACHSLRQDELHKVGPNLYGIFNSKAATREGFNYSDEFIVSTIVWDFSTLNLWLEKPYVLIPGNRMVFSGMNKEKDRLDLLAYLHQETSN
jgi:cytochrome c